MNHFNGLPDFKDAIVMLLYTGPKGFHWLFEQASNILELKGISITRRAFWASLTELVQDEKVGTIEQSEYTFQYYLTAKQRMEPIVNKIWKYFLELEGFVENQHGVNPVQYNGTIVTLFEWRKDLEFRALYVKTETDLLNKIVGKIRRLEERLVATERNALTIEKE